MSKPSTNNAERDSARGGWALGGFMFGAISSLGLNLEAAWLGVTKAIGHAPYGKQAAAVMWPLLLIFSVEVMSRTAWPATKGWKTWGWLAVRFGGFGTIGVTSAVISYGHVHTVLIYWGYTEAQARSGAFCLDALMVLCGFARLAASRTPAVFEATAGTGTPTWTGVAGGPEETPAPEVSSGPTPDSIESAPLPPRGAVGSGRLASHGPAFPGPASEPVPAPAPPGAGTVDPGRAGAVLPGRASDLDHVDQGHDPVDHTAVDHRDPGHVDQDQQDHSGSGRGPVDQGQGSTAEGHGPVHAVNLDRLTEDQLVDHYLNRAEPTLTMDQLAAWLRVSRSTAKRRVNDTRKARETGSPLRVVR